MTLKNPLNTKELLLKSLKAKKERVETAKRESAKARRATSRVENEKLNVCPKCNKKMEEYVVSSEEIMCYVCLQDRIVMPKETVHNMY